MKKISIVSLTLIGALYISNANALKVGEGRRVPDGGHCYESTQECAQALTEKCIRNKINDQYGHLEGEVTYSSYPGGHLNYAYGSTCYACSATCVAGGVSYIIDSTTSDETPTVSVDPNTTGSTTSTTAPKLKNLKK